MHAAARISAAAHGGQILVSRAVRTAVAETLAEAIELRELGAWSFQGLAQPVQLYQVCVADLPVDFAAPRSATAAG